MELHDNSLQRPNFFEGQLLTASDFQAEQDYFLEKHRHHNRYVHGWGVVWGLHVALSTDKQSVVISPGCALDCMGNELILPEPVEASMPAKAKEIYLALQYTEETVQPVPVPGEGEDVQAYTRIREWTDVMWLPDEPVHASGPGVGQVRGGRAQFDTCGAAHAVPLVHMVRRKRRWEIKRVYGKKKDRKK